MNAVGDWWLADQRHGGTNTIVKLLSSVVKLCTVTQEE